MLEHDSRIIRCEPHLFRPVALAPLGFYRHPAPATERFVEHDRAASPVPYVLMVDFFGMVALRKMYRLPGIKAQFYRLLVHAYDRPTWIARSRIDFQLYGAFRYKSQRPPVMSFWRLAAGDGDDFRFDISSAFRGNRRGDSFFPADSI